MTATIMIHNATSPTAHQIATDDGRDASSLHFPIIGGGYVAVFMPFDVAQAMVAAWYAPPPGYDALLAFVEEVRDYRPDMISGRAHDPQDEVPDMIEANTFYAFQEDAAKLAPKPKEKDAA